MRCVYIYSEYGLIKHNILHTVIPRILAVVGGGGDYFLFGKKGAIVKGSNEPFAVGQSRG